MRPDADSQHSRGPTVDIHGAAEILKVHPKTVLDLIAQGVLPACKVGRAWVLLTRDVLRYVEESIARAMAARFRAPKRRRRSPQGAC
jgi:excisionase family DNA binding protein